MHRKERLPGTRQEAGSFCWMGAVPTDAERSPRIQTGAGRTQVHAGDRGVSPECPIFPLEEEAGDGGRRSKESGKQATDPERRESECPGRALSRCPCVRRSARLHLPGRAGSGVQQSHCRGGFNGIRSCPCESLLQLHFQAPAVHRGMMAVDAERVTWQKKKSLLMSGSVLGHCCVT